jgi:NAD(P)-dependent dehydrogenase (short-subunit alcohol dehydrogenase family)
MPRLDGKATIVTGAASGIGLSTAELFAKEGARVLMADWDDKRGEEEAKRLQASGLDVAFMKVDVSDPADVKKMIDEGVKRFGRIDVLFNNAGIEGEQAPTAECTLENWDRVININLKGVFLGMKYAIPVMLRNGGGSIINNASVAGIVGFPGLPAYCASKGGVIQMTKAAALEYAKEKVRVNAVCPGIIDTPMVDRVLGGDEAARQAFQALGPVGHFGVPEDVAALVLFLAADESRFCTGGAYVVDGGLVAA